MTPPTDDPPAVRRLRRTVVGLVAAALLLAGGAKVLRPEPSLTMLSRYLPSPRAARAGGCLEIALAFWLLSGRSPRLAPATALGAIAGLGLLVAGELRRDNPLPGGTIPTHAAPADTAAVRRSLAITLGEEAFLAVLCGVALALAPPDAEDVR